MEIDDGYSLKLELAEYKGLGDTSSIQIVDEKGDPIYSLFDHVTVKPTKMGAWQLYLLNISSHVLPAYWHGIYQSRTYIFKESYIDELYPIKFHDLSELIETDQLLPSVTIVNKDASGCTMIVKCCYWNAWEGLVRERARIVLEKGRCISFKKSKETLFAYNCGIIL